MGQKSNKYLLFTIGFFTIIYGLISIVNHYNFRTYALDLGAYTNALYDYIHFQFNDSTVFKQEPENLLASHFDIYLILFAPLSLIFRTYSLLVIQILFILFGGLGIYKYFSVAKDAQDLALPATLYFFLFFGVFSALSFDYHSNVIAATIVPWFFYFFKQRKIYLSGLFLFFIIISQENMSLWMAFICLGLAIENRKDPLMRNYISVSAIACIVYFLMITSWIMPAISSSKTFRQFQHYSLLGNNIPDMFAFFTRHPLVAIKTLFINHTHHPFGDYVKAELHILLLICGLPFLILKPQYILMLIPIYFQKLYHDDYAKWGIGGQYTIEYAPIFTIGIFSVIKEFKNNKLAKLAKIVMVIAALSCTIRIMDRTIAYTDKSRIRIYRRSHYTRKYNVGKVHKLLSTIPKNAIVSAQSAFLPHLSLRDNIYQFPILKDAEFIVYSRMENTYPLEKEVFDLLTTQLENSPEWEVLFKEEFLTILKKASVQKASLVKAYSPDSTWDDNAVIKTDLQ